MLLTKRKRAEAQDRERFAGLLDHLPVWRFVKERCFSCMWEGFAFCPFDAPHFDRNACECLGCHEQTSRVVGVLVEIPGMTIREAHRWWAHHHHGAPERPDPALEFLPLLHDVSENPGSGCQLGVVHLT